MKLLILTSALIFTLGCSALKPAIDADAARKALGAACADVGTDGHPFVRCESTEALCYNSTCWVKLQQQAQASQTPVAPAQKK